MTRSKLVVQSLATLMLAGSSVAAMAADSGWYAGVSLGQSKADVSASDLKSTLVAAGYTGVVASVDNTDTGWKLFGGYQLNKNIGFEAAYVNLGSLTVNATYATPAGSPARANIDVDGFQLSAVGTLPLNDAFAVFGKVGAFFSKLDQTGTGAFAASASTDNTDWTYGLGGNWQFNQNIGLRAEWERFQGLGSAKKDTDLYSLGVVYHF
ncbi:MAG: outer membrane beta-barrel protein [Thiobacillaceae bacterium]